LVGAADVAFEDFFFCAIPEVAAKQRISRTETLRATDVMAVCSMKFMKMKVVKRPVLTTGLQK
jgi:hypothetical protein